MRKNTIFLVIATIFAVACNKNYSHDVDPPNVDSHSPYAISAEQAIERMNDFMRAWDGEETRSSQRRIKSLSSISCGDVIAATRSADLNIDMENLLYVVEFEDGGGSAIIGADTRVAPVYAVLDETVISTSDFNNAINGDNINDLSTQIAGTIIIGALADATAGTFDFRPDEEIQDDFTIRFSRTTILEQVLPLLTTKWGQKDPFNNRFPIVDGSSSGLRQPAGCVTVAVAQIINNQMPATNHEINGHTHNFGIISNFTYDRDITDTYYQDCIASFMYDIAMELDVEYHNENPNNPQTTSTINKAKRFLISLDFNNVSITPLEVDNVVDMLNCNKPVYARGVDAVNDSGHAWVIDGWKKVKTDIIERVTYQGGGTTESIVETTIYQYAHCNFGWKGECDGYYKFNLFDITNTRRFDAVELNYGDVLSQRDYVFTENLKMLRYDY